MVLCNTNLKKFFCESAGKKIVCFGAGKEFRDMLQNFSEFPWHEKIIYLLDNDHDKWGREIEVDNKYYQVMCPSTIYQLNCKDVVIIICSSFYISILEQLERLSNLNDCKCYIYELMACKSLHENIPIKKTGPFLIPPIIHYCWFGKTEIPDAFKKYIESWRRFCPEYEIIEWNEDNCDITENQFAFDAYQAGKFGFVPDYFRLKIIYEYGGIYLDTDVELLKNLDDLRREEAFCGLETPGVAAFGLGFGAIPQNEVISMMLHRYKTISFSVDPNDMKSFISPLLQTKDLISLGMKPGNRWQKVKSMTVFPIEVFAPQNVYTGELEISDYSYSIHHYAASWFSATKKLALHNKLQYANKLLLKM